MKKLLGLLLIITVVFALTACSRTEVKKAGYTSSYTAFINLSDRNDSTLTKEEQETDKDMLNSCVQIMESNSLLSKVCDSLGESKYTVSQLEDMVDAEVLENSYIIKVSVTADTPEEAYEIAKAHADAAPQCIAQIVEGSSMKFVNYPTLPKE